MERTGVPEAAVHEHGDASTREQHVRPSPRHAGKWSVDPVAQAASMELTAEQELRIRVASSLT